MVAISLSSAHVKKAKVSPLHWYSKMSSEDTYGMEHAQCVQTIKPARSQYVHGKMPSLNLKERGALIFHGKEDGNMKFVQVSKHGVQMACKTQRKEIGGNVREFIPHIGPMIKNGGKDQAFRGGLPCKLGAS